MATEIIDGVGTQNHVTSDQVGLSQAGMIGSGAIILPVGEQLGYDIISNNQVNIKDGVYVIQGKRGWIQTGTVEQCTIDTGNNGQYRNDLICVKYTKDAQSKVEQFAIAVVKGTPGAAGTDPTYTTGDINNGALESYTPIYRVRLNGINIVGVDLMASKINSMLDMVADIGNLTALTTTEKNSLVGAINELKTAINTLNGNIAISDIEYTKDPVVSFTNLSIRSFGKVVSIHGIVRTAYISQESTLIFINGTLLPSTLCHFSWATPDGNAGTGYINPDGSIVFDTNNLTGSNDIYIDVSYIAR